MNRFNRWRWKKFSNGYVVDKVVTNCAMLVIFAYLILVCWSMGFDFSKKVYVSCDSPSPCNNPLYEYRDRSWCVWDFCDSIQLEPGFEFGSKPSVLFDFAWSFSIIVLLGAFVLNHLLHNRNKIFWGDLK